MANNISLCKVPRAVTPEGLAGVNASVYLPGYGIWFADGKQIAFPNGLLAQASSHSVTGTTKNLPFRKDVGICIAPAS